MTYIYNARSHEWYAESAAYLLAQDLDSYSNDIVAIIEWAEIIKEIGQFSIDDKGLYERVRHPKS